MSWTTTSIVYNVTTLTPTTLGAGTHAIYAVWASPEFVNSNPHDPNQGNVRTGISPGWANPSDPTAYQQTVNQATTLPVVTGAAPSSSTTFGQAVTFTANVNITSPGTPVTPGTINGALMLFFSVDASNNYAFLGYSTVPVSTTGTSATYNFTTTQLAVGTYRIRAIWASPGYVATGDANNQGNFASSVSTGWGDPTPNRGFQQTVRNATSQTLYTSANNYSGASTASANAGTSVSFLAIVSSNGGTPTGTMNFYDNGAFLGTGTFNGSSSSSVSYIFTTSFKESAVGTHTITARYSGDSTFDPADASLTLTINSSLVQ